MLLSCTARLADALEKVSNKSWRLQLLSLIQKHVEVHIMPSVLLDILLVELAESAFPFKKRNCHSFDRQDQAAMHASVVPGT